MCNSAPSNPSIIALLCFLGIKNVFMTNVTMENSTQTLQLLLYLISILHVYSQPDVSKMFSNDLVTGATKHSGTLTIIWLEQSTVKLVHWRRTWITRFLQQHNRPKHKQKGNKRVSFTLQVKACIIWAWCSTHLLAAVRWAVQRRQEWGPLKWVDHKED